MRLTTTSTTSSSAGLLGFLTFCCRCTLVPLLLLLLLLLVTTCNAQEGGGREGGGREGGGQLQRQQQAMFDFNITLDEVSVTLTNETNFDEAIIFTYLYSGVKDQNSSQVNFTFDIYEHDCNTPYALYGNTTQALYFTRFDETETNKVYAMVGINLTTIEGPVGNDVWFQDKETEADLKFCARWNIEVDGFLFQFNEVNVTATINLKEGDGFTVEQLDVGLDRQDADDLDEDVDVDFPINVFLCNDTADDIGPAPTDGFNQGDPIQVCMELATEQSDVFVQNIFNMNYTGSATEVTDIVPLVEDGTLNFGSTALVDCGQVDGVCRSKFVPAAGMFVKTTGANNLVITGSVEIAFGNDGSRRARRRRIASSFTGQSGGGGGVRRNMQDGTEQLAPFEFVVGELQPGSGSGSSSSPESVFTEYGVLIGVLVGSVVVVIAVGIAAFFLCRRKRMRAAVAETPVLDKDQTQKVDEEEDEDEEDNVLFSSQLDAPAADRSSLEESDDDDDDDDRYEIVEM